MKKILVIEDNLEMRENISEILELAAYEVYAGENGKLGVALAKEHLPDLIVCDIMMPELDGYGVLYLLSRDPATAGIPFIFLSAKAEKSDMRRGMNEGADDYITKPFEEADLLTAIDSRLKRSTSFKNGFQGDANSLDAFINEARGGQELKGLSENRKLRKYGKKEVIFHEGDYPNGLFFVNKGKVKTSKMNDDTKEITTGLYKAGEFFGYMALLQNSNYTDTATALEETELYRVPRQDFLDLIHRNHEVAYHFIKMLSSNVVEKEEQLLDMAYKSVRMRVADGLIRLLQRYRENEGENFKIAISRDDLASIVGTATETVIRTLSDFKEEQLIEVKGSQITIINEEKLANLKF